MYYVHHAGTDRRLDEWTDEGRIDLSTATQGKSLSDMEETTCQASPPPLPYPQASTPPLPYP